jgi:hypothetical protein
LPPALLLHFFAYLGSSIRERIIKKRLANGKTGESPKFEKALKAFDKYGIYGLAFLGPLIIGTQFAAAAAVAAGVKPLRASLIVTLSMVLWASGIAAVMAAFDLTFGLV